MKQTKIKVAAGVIIALISFSVIMGSCKKKKEECETNQTGTFSFTNSSTKSRKLWVDQSYKKTLSSGEKYTSSLSNGSHKWETSETTITDLDDSVEGCIEHSFTITQCQTTSESCNE